MPRLQMLYSEKRGQVLNVELLKLDSTPQLGGFYVKIWRHGTVANMMLMGKKYGPVMIHSVVDTGKFGYIDATAN